MLSSLGTMLLWYNFTTFPTSFWHFNPRVEGSTQAWLIEFTYIFLKLLFLSIIFTLPFFLSPPIPFMSSPLLLKHMASYPSNRITTWVYIYKYMITPCGSHVCRADLLVLANPSQGSSLEKTDSSPFRSHPLPIVPLRVESRENSFIQVGTPIGVSYFRSHYGSL